MIALGKLAQAPFAARQVVAIRGGESLTWDRFRAEVGGAARQLAGCGRVALICQDSWCFAVGMFGALSAGATVVLPPNSLPATLAALAGDVERVVDDCFVPEGAEWAELLDEDAPRLCFHTSGSTGQPKRVERSLSQMNGEIAALHQIWGEMLAGAPALATVPHQHVYGLMFKLLWPLAAGRPFFARRHDLWEDVLAEMPPGALLVTSPAHLTRLGGLPALPPDRLPRMILSAGAPLPEDAAAEAYRLLGTPVAEIYGSTETGAMATRRRDRPDPAWMPLPGYGVSRGEAGLLHLDAPGVVAAGGIEIADRMEEVEGGGFRLLGRADRIAKIEGKRISLDEVERALAALPEIAAVALVVLNDPRPVLAVVMVLSPMGRALLEERGSFRLSRALRLALADELESAALPRRWRFVEALPSGAMGKCSSRDLEALFEEPGRG